MDYTVCIEVHFIAYQFVVPVQVYNTFHWSQVCIIVSVWFFFRLKKLFMNSVLVKMMESSNVSPDKFWLIISHNFWGKSLMFKMISEWKKFYSEIKSIFKYFLLHVDNWFFISLILLGITLYFWSLNYS